MKGATKFESMDEVRGLFDPVSRTDFTMNWFFCSTSGVHGSHLRDLVSRTLAGVAKSQEGNL